jgi:hypothetical protein
MAPELEMEVTDGFDRRIMAFDDIGPLNPVIDYNKLAKSLLKTVREGDTQAVRVRFISRNQLVGLFDHDRPNIGDDDSNSVP